jgi:diguanylate cyclase (GGDEF)-like protein/PAS domain S-box-containing protein
MLKEVFRCLLVYNSQSNKKLHPNLSKLDSLKITWEEHYVAALQKATSGLFDVVIFDTNISLPENLVILRSFLSIASNIPIIITDESGDIDNIKKFMLAGAHDYMQKGTVSDRDIIRIIRHAVIRKECEISQREAYRMIAHFTNDWEYWENPDGSIRYVSPAAEKITSYKPQEFMDNPALYKEIIVHEDRQRFAGHKCGDVTRKGVRKTHFRIRRKDGGTRWIEHTCQSAFDDRNIFLGVRVTNRDMTDLVNADEDLEKSEQKFQKLIETANDAIFISEVESGLITNANQKAADLTGYAVDELIGKPYYFIHPQEDQAFYKDFFEDRLYNSAAMEQNIYLRHRDGNKIPVEVSSSVTSFRGKTIMLEIYRDITERLEAEMQRRKLSAAVEQSPASAVIMDTEGNIEYVNPKVLQTIGYNLNDLIGRNWFTLKQERVSKTKLNDIWNSLNSGMPWRGEIQSKRNDGTFIWEYTAMSPIRNSDGSVSHFLAVSEDISIRKEYEEKLLRQANYDALTNLPNRILMLDRLKQAIIRVKRESIKSALLFIDLDHFKDINDTLGHEMGDKLLIEVSQRLQTCIRASDTVARLGGDEFLIILHNTIDETDASVVAQRVLDCLAVPIILPTQEVFISASIGITICPNDGDDPQILLRNADAAMYQSKEFSRNTFHFFREEMNKKAHKRMQISSRLRYAVDENALFLLYQPIIEVSTGRIIGTEALIRWKDAQMGTVFPDEFIPIAEETNQIIPIGKWVMETALKQTKIWQKNLFPQFHIAVNVSVKQLKDPHFGSFVEDIIRSVNIDPKTIDLEITEGFILNQNALVLKNLEILKNLGVNLAVDDFGTGYSSFAYFSQFVFRIIKIDRKFLTDVEKDGSKAKLYKAIINVGKSLGLCIVSEGVETKDHLDFINKEKCELCQGYYFSKPISPEDLERLYSEKKNLL